MSLTGYKQNQKYVNCVPEVKTKIHALSNIRVTRYDPYAEKTCNAEDFMKRPVRYNFSITTQAKEAFSLFTHNCYFDTLKSAQDAHKDFRLKLYDQKVKPYLNKLKTTKLTGDEKTEILDIFDEIDKLKEIY